MDILINVLHTAGYVGSLFVLPSARIGHGIDSTNGRPITRDTPHVIRARMVGVSVSSAISLATVAGLAIGRDPSSSPQNIAGLLGLWKSGITPAELVRLAVFPLACTASLFIGPLFTTALDHRLIGMKRWSYRVDIVQRLERLQGLRNFVIGPLTEELVFRSALIGTAWLNGRSLRHLVFITPLYFGIAHAHHAYEVYVKYGRTRQSLQRGLMSAAFQFAYTSLFGFYAAFLYVRTGSVVPPLLAHVFCNIMGFPDAADAIEAHTSKQTFIITAYVTGIAAFLASLLPLTHPSWFGGSLFI